MFEVRRVSALLECSDVYVLALYVAQLFHYSCFKICCDAKKRLCHTKMVISLFIGAIDFRCVEYHVLEGVPIYLCAHHPI